MTGQLWRLAASSAPALLTPWAVSTSNNPKDVAQPWRQAGRQSQALLTPDLQAQWEVQASLWL